jgi:predicted component of type VI protein secretion system
MTKFERAFGYYLRKVNQDPPDDALRELIVSSAELVGEGLLGLIRPDGDE